MPEASDIAEYLNIRYDDSAMRYKPCHRQANIPSLTLIDSMMIPIMRYANRGTLKVADLANLEPATRAIAFSFILTNDYISYEKGVKASVHGQEQNPITNAMIFFQENMRLSIEDAKVAIKAKSIELENE